MRIQMIITRGDELGGAQTYVASLASLLVRNGHTVQVVSGSAGPLTRQLAAQGIPAVTCDRLIRTISPARDTKCISALRRLMREFDPDVVATNCSKAGIVGRLAARSLGLPCVVTIHGWSFTEGVSRKRRLAYAAIERSLARFATRIVCVSEYDRHLGIASGIPASRVIAIPNGVADLPSPKLRYERDDTATAGRPVRAIMVSRFADQKDQELLVRVAHTLPGLEVDLVGDGPNLAHVQAVATSLGIGDRVHFLGSRGDVSDLLADADIFVLSTNYEGFPLASLEAMRSGLPVVVTDVGGAAEAIIEGTTGLTYPRGDAVALRSRLGLLATNPDMRLAMGRAGRAHYEQHYTLNRMARETLAVYREAVPMPIPTERIVLEQRKSQRGI